MGIDGRLLLGDGIMVNTTYLPDNLFDFLAELGSKYLEIFEYDRMNGPTRSDTLIFWGSKPTMLFPVDTVDRRPLIINSSKQLPMMKPVYNQHKRSYEMDLNSKDLWTPSYGGHLMRLNDYWEEEDIIRERIIKQIISKEYEVNSDFLPEPSIDDYPPNALIPESINSDFFKLLDRQEIQILTSILRDKKYTLVGQYLFYMAD